MPTNHADASDREGSRLQCRKFGLSSGSCQIEITIKAKYRPVATLSRDQAILVNARHWRYWSLCVQCIVPPPHRFCHGADVVEVLLTLHYWTQTARKLWTTDSLII